MDFHSEKPASIELDKWLAIKRHEQPPPGYFLDFSDGVMARIQAGKERKKVSWWNRLWLDFNPKPVLITSYGLTVSALFLFGMALAQLNEDPDSSTQAELNPFESGLITATTLPGNRLVDSGNLVRVDTVIRNPNQESSMYPVLSSSPPAFFIESSPRLQKASFQVK